MRTVGWLGCAALAIVALASGCRARPPTLARTHPASVTMQVNGLVRWIDRAAGTLELHVECRPTTVEVWCYREARTRCESRRVVSAPTTCPSDVLTVTTGWGATAQAPVTPDGLATFTVDVASARSHPGAAPGPRNGWMVSRGGAELAWRDATDLTTNVAPPPSPPPAIPQRTYRGVMIATDLTIVVSAPLVFAAIWDGGHEIGGLFHIVAYLAAGPVVHHLHGNPRSGRSFARRLLYPVAGIAAGAVIGSLLERDCVETDEYVCGGAAVGLGFLGSMLGIVAAIVHDAVDAHVDAAPPRIAPVVSSDGDRVMFGAAGRF